MSRIKLPDPYATIETKAQAEIVLGDIRELSIRKARLLADREEERQRIEESCKEALAILDDEINTKSEALRTWAELNPEEFGKRRSLELTHGTVGWRIGMPKLVKKCKAKWDDLVGVVDARLGSAFIRVKKEVNREAILDARDTLDPVQVKACGLAIEQGDAFYVEPKMDQVETRTVVDTVTKLAALFVFLLGAVFGQAANVGLTWDPNTEADLGGYRVYYGPASRSYTNVVNVGRTNVARVTGLLDGAAYFFAVTAYNTNGLESDYSNEVRIQTGTRPAAPGGLGGSQERDVVQIQWRGKTNSNGTITPVGQVLVAANLLPATVAATIVTTPSDGTLTTQNRTVTTTNGLAEIVGKSLRPPFGAWVGVKTVTIPSGEISSVVFN
ncbi:MAG: host-nuclease inhibitor Gam family protein [Verrucomicrobia bacterium]|nr:host-nuclease inhibitor Gam family protein [Verrucomicrobiota bacterium]